MLPPFSNRPLPSSPLKIRLTLVNFSESCEMEDIPYRMTLPLSAVPSRRNHMQLMVITTRMLILISKLQRLLSMIRWCPLLEELSITLGRCSFPEHIQQVEEGVLAVRYH
jgi:hypothetical protein